MPEFGLVCATAYGPSRNPWAPDRSAGGPSGGSAAAVAAGWCRSGRAATAAAPHQERPRHRRRAVVIGYVAGPRAEIDLPSWLLDDVALLPVNMFRQERRARELAPELVRMLAAGELPNSSKARVCR